MEHHHTTSAETIKSSFINIDSRKLFEGLRLKTGEYFLDLACGSGDYSIAAADITGSSGRVYALDIWEGGIKSTIEKASKKGIDNIVAQVVDVSTVLPIKNNSIDVCLIASAFHDLLHTQATDSAMYEIVRVLKSQAILGIVEYKRMLSPGDLERIVTLYSFEIVSTTDIGPSHYLSVFRAQ